MRISVSRFMKMVFLVATFVSAAVACVCVQPVAAQQHVTYFYEEGCSQCEVVSLILDELVQEGVITVTQYDVATVEGYNLFKQYGFAMTPALIINGEKLEAPIEKSAILEALQSNKYEWYHFVIALGLGLLSGCSPTLMQMHSDIISEVARTTRQELDVVLKSLLFYGGIFAIILLLFFIFNTGTYLNFLAVLFGFFISVNLLNSGLHSFNSYTRIDLYLKAKFIALDSFSVLKLGLLHGIAKFPDSVPFFIPVMYVILVKGAYIEDLVMGLLFLTGIVAVYVVILLLAIKGRNLFRTFKTAAVEQLYFSVTGIAVMGVALVLFWEVFAAVNVVVVFIFVSVVIVGSGILIGFNRRIIY